MVRAESSCPGFTREGSVGSGLGWLVRFCATPSRGLVFGGCVAWQASTLRRSHTHRRRWHREGMSDRHARIRGGSVVLTASGRWGWNVVLGVAARVRVGSGVPFRGVGGAVYPSTVSGAGKWLG